MPPAAADTAVASWACAVLLLPLLAAGAATTQTCDTSEYPLSTPTGQFDDHTDGTVSDRHSKLMWFRCSVGQQWSGGTCVGTAKLLTWQQAHLYARELNAQGLQFYSDWRLPQVHELAMIAERQCRNPRINLHLFPTTPPQAFWSFTSRQAADNDVAAFVLSFGPEGVGYAKKHERHYVRLVRSGP